MLSKNKRVSKKLFTEILEKGLVLYGDFFIFKYVHSKNPHFSVVVSKKILKGAVARNKLKRKGYNAIREIKTEDISGIFFYKKSGINKNFKEIKEDIYSILLKKK